MAAQQLTTSSTRFLLNVEEGAIFQKKYPGLLPAKPTQVLTITPRL